MSRIATIPFQRTLSSSLMSAQQKLSDTQLRLNSGKKAQDLAGLGSQAVQVLSARTLLSQQQAQSSAAQQLGTTLSLYDANIGSIDSAVTDLRQQLMTAIGTGQSVNLQGAAEGAFAQFRASLNAAGGDGVLFGGSRTDVAPFRLQALTDTAGATPATAFANDDVRASARMGDGQDVTYGITASELGTGLLAAFRTLAEAGPIGPMLTAPQTEALKTAIGQIDAALPGLRTVNGGNGQRQNQVEALQAHGEARADLLTNYLSEIEDADYGQIAADLAQSQTILRASYSVFSQLSELSLVNYLK